MAQVYFFGGFGAIYYVHAYLEVARFVIASPIETHLRGPVEVSRCRHTGIRHLYWAGGRAGQTEGGMGYS